MDNLPPQDQIRILQERIAQLEMGPQGAAATHPQTPLRETSTPQATWKIDALQQPLQPTNDTNWRSQGLQASGFRLHGPQEKESLLDCSMDSLGEVLAVKPENSEGVQAVNWTHHPRKTIPRHYDVASVAIPTVTVAPPPQQTSMPSAQELLQQLAREMTSCFRQVAAETQAASPRQMVHIGLTQTYSGKLEEDPQRFLQAIERYLARYQIYDDFDRIEVMRKQLTGAAKEWADSSRNVPLTYDLFVERFKRRFDDYDQLSPLLMKLYGERQAKGEPIHRFIDGKLALIARVDKPIPMEAYIDLIINLLDEDYSIGVRGCRPQSYEELMRFASQLERNIAASRTPAATVQRRDAHPQGHRESPNACRHCSGWHYHGECPENPYRHSNRQYYVNGRPEAPPQRNDVQRRDDRGPPPRPQPRRDADNRGQPPQQQSGNARRVGGLESRAPQPARAASSPARASARVVEPRDRR